MGSSAYIRGRVYFLKFLAPKVTAKVTVLGKVTVLEKWRFRKVFYKSPHFFIKNGWHKESFRWIRNSTANKNQCYSKSGSIQFDWIDSPPNHFPSSHERRTVIFLLELAGDIKRMNQSSFLSWKKSYYIFHFLTIIHSVRHSTNILCIFSENVVAWGSPDHLCFTKSLLTHFF